MTTETELRADVVVPVYRDVEVTRACLESVLEHSDVELRRLLIVNDCSPDAGMGEMLEVFRERDLRVIVLNNEANLGFVRSANRGMAVRGGDVVLLNSDTRVTPGWLRELLEVARENPQCGATCPLSNNATLCSVPVFGEGTEAEKVPFEELDLANLSPRVTRMPTGVGFCMLLTNRALDAVGLFDPVYGRGYNEENDWCQRARGHGFEVLRANRAFVYHLGAISFGEQRSELDRRNEQILSARYPNYRAETREFAKSLEARSASHWVSTRLGRG